VTGRARHLPFAGPFERHAGGLRDLEQASRPARPNRDLLAVPRNEGDLNRAYPCCAAAYSPFRPRLQALPRSCSARTETDRAARLLGGEPDRREDAARLVRFAGAGRAGENITSRTSDISRPTSSPSRRRLRLPFQRLSALPLSVQPANSSRARSHSAATCARPRPSARARAAPPRPFPRTAPGSACPSAARSPARRR
jgi:hypothetical protein